MNSYWHIVLPPLCAAAIGSAGLAPGGGGCGYLKVFHPGLDAGTSKG